MRTVNLLFIKLSEFMLIMLWIYAATSKLLKFSVFEQEMSSQALPGLLIVPLTYLLPLTELLAAGLLFIPSCRLFGLWLSAVLMTFFTTYIAYVIFGISSVHPCSCGGILSRMGWQAHFYFNLTYLLLTITAIYISKRTEKGGRLARE